MSKPINILHKFSLLYFGSAGSALLLGVALGASPNMIAVYLLISAFCLMRLFYFQLSLKQVKTGAFDEKKVKTYVSSLIMYHLLFLLCLFYAGQHYSLQAFGEKTYILELCKTGLYMGLVTVIFLKVSHSFTRFIEVPRG